MDNKDLMVNNTETYLKNNRQEQLQFLRFIAFVMIFNLHCNFYSIIHFPRNYYAAQAVSFFFILSGCVTVFARGDLYEISGKTVCRYLKNKLLKMYPLYFATLMFAFLTSDVALNIAKHEWKVAEPKLITLLKDLLLIQNWFLKDHYTYNGVGWFLSTMFFLYVFMLPMLYLMSNLGKRFRKYRVFLWILVGGVAFVCSYIYCYLVRKTDVGFWGYIFPPARLFEIIIGMSIGFVSRDIKTCEKYIFPTMVNTIIEILVLLFWGGNVLLPVATWNQFVSRWIIPNSAVIFCFSLGRGLISKILKKSIFVFCGEISFGCFLIHQLIIKIYMQMSGVANISKLGNLFSYFSCLFITVIFSTLLLKARTLKKK